MDEDEVLLDIRSVVSGNYISLELGKTCVSRGHSYLWTDDVS